MDNVSRLPVTFALIFANVLVFVGVTASAGSQWAEALVIQPAGVIGTGGLLPEAVSQGELWRLVTSMFLHASFIHLAVNMLALYFLGSFAEQVFGRDRFFALYLISGISGGIAFLYFGTFERPAVGASGAIFGLLGGILGFTVRRGTFTMQNPVIRQLVIITLINLFIGASIPAVSNIVHVGGLVGGALFGAVIAGSVYSQKRFAILAPAALLLGLEAGLIAIWFVFLPQIQTLF